MEKCFTSLQIVFCFIVYQLELFTTLNYLTGTIKGQLNLFLKFQKAKNN